VDFLITLQTVSKIEYYCDTQRTGPARLLPGHYMVNGIFRNMVLVNAGFHVQNYSENYPQFGQALSKTLS
jgi:hypothetical protein